jgi:phenylacetate-coenzyme A ligase PaaK-like adenylate-forming protein
MLEADLLERDGWTRDDLLAYQKERVRALITHAASRSPYYREVLGADACRAAYVVESDADGRV